MGGEAWKGRVGGREITKSLSRLRGNSSRAARNVFQVFTSRDSRSQPIYEAPQSKGDLKNMLPDCSTLYLSQEEAAAMVMNQGAGFVVS